MMIDQTKPAPSTVAPLFCFNVKATSFFIFFSIVAFLVHLWIPSMVGVALIGSHFEESQHIEHWRDQSFDQPNKKSYSYYLEPSYKEQMIREGRLNSRFRRILSGKSFSSENQFPVQSSSFKYQRDVPSKSLDHDDMQRYNMASPLRNFDYKDPNYQMNDMNFQKVSLNEKPMSFDYKNASYQGEPYRFEDQEEMAFEDLMICFAFIHQVFMICFFVVVLIFKCARASFSRCMMFSFSISNLINSIIYIMISSFFFGFIMFEEFIGKKFDADRTSRFLLFLSIFVPMVIIYAFYVYWSALFVSVAKEVGDSKSEDAQVNTELVQEPVN